MLSEKKFVILANAAIISLCVLIAGVVVWRFVLPHEPSRVGAKVPVGRQVQIPNISWSSARSTVVLALSTNCHFCGENAPLFRSLISNVHQQGARVIAVFPPNQAETAKYLSGLGLAVDATVSLPLTQIGVSGTPAVLVVGRSGVVVDGWVGAVPSGEYENALKKLKSSIRGNS